MARSAITVCDLCNKIVEDADFKLVLSSGKGKDKEVTKAEICLDCYEKIKSAIESSFDFNSDFSRPVINVLKGENIVPSTINNVTAAPQLKKSCSHEKKSYEPPDITCLDCGHAWKV